MELEKNTPIRFPASSVAVIKRLADAENMTVSAWIRREVEREISRRKGRCSHCGQEIR